CERRGAAARGEEPRLAGGMDRQALGGKPGGRCRLGAAAAARLSAAHRRRYRARTRFRQPAGRARRAAAPRADVAYGQAQLRKLRRARSYSGIHLLLPDALSVLLRESAGERGRGGRPGLAAGPPRPPSPPPPGSAPPPPLPPVSPPS